MDLRKKRESEQWKRYGGLSSFTVVLNLLSENVF
jgi:hypothetical protein